MIRSTLALALTVALCVAVGAVAGPSGVTMPAGPPQLPDPNLTPGVVDPTATAAVICQRGYTARPGVRHVTASLKRKVFAAYGIDPRVGGPWEVDHLVPLELGGSNAPGNLWPQSYSSQPFNAHRKDQLEDRLHALVCSGAITLAQAQTEIRTDWIASWRRHVAVAP